MTTEPLSASNISKERAQWKDRGNGLVIIYTENGHSKKLKELEQIVKDFMEHNAYGHTSTFTVLPSNVASSMQALQHVL